MSASSGVVLSLAYLTKLLSAPLAAGDKPVANSTEPDSITELQLIGRGLTSIQPDVAKALASSLIRIDASNNALRTVNTLAACTRLTTAILQRNDIGSATVAANADAGKTNADGGEDGDGEEEEGAGGSRKLIVPDAKSRPVATGIEVLPAALKLLNLSHNRLCDADLPAAAMQRFAQLKAFVATNNALTVIPSGLSAQLNSLVLSNNLIRAVSGLSRLSQLTKLSLSNNALTALPAELNSLPELSELRLNGNAIKAVAGAAVRALTRLKLIDLGSNKIASLDDVAGLKELPYLRNLNLRGNSVAVPPPKAGEVESEAARAYAASVRGMFPLLEISDSRRIKAKSNPKLVNTKQKSKAGMEAQRAAKYAAKTAQITGKPLEVIKATAIKPVKPPKPERKHAPTNNSDAAATAATAAGSKHARKPAPAAAAAAAMADDGDADAELDADADDAEDDSIRERRRRRAAEAKAEAEAASAGESGQGERLMASKRKRQHEMREAAAAAATAAADATDSNKRVKPNARAMPPPVVLDASIEEIDNGMDLTAFLSKTGTKLPPAAPAPAPASAKPKPNKQKPKPANKPAAAVAAAGKPGAKPAQQPKSKPAAAAAAAAPAKANAKSKSKSRPAASDDAEREDSVEADIEHALMPDRKREKTGVVSITVVKPRSATAAAAHVDAPVAKPAAAPIAAAFDTGFDFGGGGGGGWGDDEPVAAPAPAPAAASLAKSSKPKPSPHASKGQKQRTK